MTQLMLKLDNPVADNRELSRFTVALGNELLFALSLEVIWKIVSAGKAKWLW